MIDSPTQSDTNNGRDSHRPSFGTILLGTLLILGGLVWLLDASGLVDISLGAALATALVLIGLGLIASAWSGSDYGLVTIGIILTLILTLTTATDIRLTGGIGDREVRPTSFEDVNTQYSLLMGSQHIDLGDVTFPPGETRIVVGHGIGELRIELPPAVGARVEWRIAAGEIHALGHDESGVFLSGNRQTANYESAERRVLIDVSHGLGEVEVSQ